MRVLRATGVQSEARLSFAGLHQLLRPVLGAADALPARAARRAATAFGMAERRAARPVPDRARGAEPARRRRGAERRCCSWSRTRTGSTAPTADVLAFVGAPLDAEPVALLVAVRDGASGAFDRPRPAGAAPGRARRRVLRGAAGRGRRRCSAPSLRDRLLREAAGNPLALTRAAARARRPAGRELPEWLPLTARLEHAFAARALELPRGTRTRRARRGARRRRRARRGAGGRVDPAGRELEVDAIVPAIGARLLDLDGTRLRFHHPLMRSAIHQAAEVDERCAAHAALAVVLAGEPDRRVWHRAASLLRPDGAVARELEAAAQRAERRGATAVALAALEAPARLSDDAALRAARLMDAGELAFELGRHDTMLELLDTVAPLALGARERQRLEWLRETLGDRALVRCTRGSTTLAAHRRPGCGADGDVRARAGLARRAVALRCWWSNPEQRTRDAVAAAAEALPVAPDDPRADRHAGDAPRRWSSGPRGHRQPGRRRAHRDDPRSCACSPRAASSRSGTSRRACASRRRGRRAARAGPARAARARARHAGVGGEPDRQRGRRPCPPPRRRARLARETDQPRWSRSRPAAEAAIAAARCAARPTRPRRWRPRPSASILPMAAGPMLSLVQLARGQAALGVGPARRRLRAPAAHVRPGRHRPTIRFVSRWALGDLAEAAQPQRQARRRAHAGRAARAARRRRPRPRSPSACCSPARCSPPTSEAGARSTPASARICRAGRSPARGCCSRYGEWLRRRPPRRGVARAAARGARGVRRARRRAVGRARPRGAARVGRDQPAARRPTRSTSSPRRSCRSRRWRATG